MADLSVKLVVAGVTDVGRQRSHNEDSFALLTDCQLYVVADGMGGHQAGDIASQLATSLVAEFFHATQNEEFTWPSAYDRSLSDEENRLLTGISLANRRIFEQSREQRECYGMGTTIVAAHFSERRGRMYWGHVGDSRAYRIREGNIQQLTRDHSLQNESHLFEREYAELPKNVITRALGMDEAVDVDLAHDEVKVGDVYLLCSDGLSGMVTDDRIRQLITEASDPSDACKRLVAAANQQGGDDNVTAVVIRIELGVHDDDEATAQDEGLPGDSAPDSVTPAR